MGSVAPNDTTDTNQPRILDLGTGRTLAKNLTLGEKLHAKGLGVDHRRHLEEGYLAAMTRAMMSARKALRAPGIIHRQTTGAPGTFSLIHLRMTRLSTGRTI